MSLAATGVQPNAPDLQFVIPSCRDTVCTVCTLPTDIILESTDGVHLGGHKSVLESYNSFLPSAMMPEIIQLPHNSATLQGLLLFMHHTEEQPNLRTLDFDDFEPLAHAVEFHFVESARQACRLRMELELPDKALAVFAYAAKYDYRDLLDKAAVYTIDVEYETMKNITGDNRDILYAWFRYREILVQEQRRVWSTSSIYVTHKKNSPCDSTNWTSFRQAVLVDLGNRPSAALRLKEIVADHKPILEECQKCEDRAMRISMSHLSSGWAGGKGPLFSTFIV